LRFPDRLGLRAHSLRIQELSGQQSDAQASKSLLAEANAQISTLQGNLETAQTERGKTCFRRQISSLLIGFQGRSKHSYNRPVVAAIVILPNWMDRIVWLF